MSLLGLFHMEMVTGSQEHQDRAISNLQASFKLLILLRLLLFHWLKQMARLHSESVWMGGETGREL